MPTKKKYTFRINPLENLTERTTLEVESLHFHPSSLEKKVYSREHFAYPSRLAQQRWYCDGRCKMPQNHYRLLDAERESLLSFEVNAAPT